MRASVPLLLSYHALSQYLKRLDETCLSKEELQSMSSGYQSNCCPKTLEELNKQGIRIIMQRWNIV